MPELDKQLKQMADQLRRGLEMVRQIIGTRGRKFKDWLFEVPPMGHSGELLDDFLDNFAGKQSGAVKNIVRQGYAQGKTNQEMVRQIIGTKARKFKDGLFEVSRRNAEANIRTAVQHVASSARQELLEENKSVAERYQWVSTLDSITSPICQHLDGKQFEVGKGPVPPAHFNCRSATVPVLAEKYQFLSEGRTRSAEFGPVDAKETYYDWLKAQPEKVQIEALGPVRAKLFREGGLTPERFSALQFDKNFKPLSLKEMMEIEPEAFKNAGITQAVKGDGGPVKTEPGGDAVRNALRSAEAGEGFSSLYETYESQKAQLDKLERSGVATIQRNPERFLGAGAEHDVELSASGDRVVKFTKPGKYGVTVEGVDFPVGSFVELRESTPGEYLKRIEASNRLFGDDMAVIGVHRAGENVGLVTTQKFITGTKPTQGAVDSFLSSKGFSKVPDNVIGSDYLPGKTWYHKESGYLIADTKPNNFILGKNGILHPIDLIVQEVDKGSALFRAIK